MWCSSCVCGGGAHGGVCVRACFIVQNYKSEDKKKLMKLNKVKFNVQTVSRFLYVSEPLAPHALGLQLLMRLSEPLPLFTQRVTSTICVGGMGATLTIAALILALQSPHWMNSACCNVTTPRGHGILCLHTKGMLTCLRCMHGFDVQYCVCTLTTTTTPMASRTTPPKAAPTADITVVSTAPVWAAPEAPSSVGVGLVGCGGWELEGVISDTGAEGCTS